MAKWLLAALCIFTLPALGQNAQSLSRSAENFEKQGQYEKAAVHYTLAAEAAKNNAAIYIEMMSRAGANYYQVRNLQRAFTCYYGALKKTKGTKDSLVLIDIYSNLGLICHEKQNLVQALDFYNRSLAIAATLQKIDANFARLLMHCGQIYISRGEYEEARQILQRAQKLCETLNNEEGLADSWHYLGRLYGSEGKSDQALQAFDKAIAIDQKIGNELKIAQRFQDIGAIYSQWGKFAQAIIRFQEAAKISRSAKANRLLAKNLSSLAFVHNCLGEYQKASEYYQLLLPLVREQSKNDRTQYFIDTGTTFFLLGEHNKALNSLHQAYDEHGQKNDAIAAAIFLAYGRVYYSGERYKEALEHYEKALAIYRKQNNEEMEAIQLSNIGYIYYSLGKDEEAIESLTKAIALFEKQRGFLPDVLIECHQFLVSSYVRLGFVVKAIETADKINAVLRLRKIKQQPLVPVDLLEVRSNIPENMNFIVFVNDVDGNISRLSINQKELQMTRIDHTALASIYEYFATSIETMDRDLRESTRLDPHRIPNFDFLWRISPLQKEKKLELIVRYYRSLLQVEPKPETQKLARMLHNLLLDGSQTTFKEHLVIVPDNALSLLPFASLINDEGKYLVEKHHIAYAPSLAMFSTLQKRYYSENRKPIWALGGVDYQVINYSEENIENEQQLEALQKRITNSLIQQKNVEYAYGILKIGDYGELPGTLDEIQAVSQSIPNAQIAFGKQATEADLKNLSQQKQLAEYKVLHLAAYAFTVDEIPLLSALSLARGNDEEDGYVCLPEIAKLELQADLVNLTVCETGVSKKFSGEGMVAWSQSFLIAGSNRVLVSLWPVADQATAKYTTEVYSLVRREEISYDQAVTVVSRRFIRGEFGKKYQNPYFWSSFVLYGQSRWSGANLKKILAHKNSILKDPLFLLLLGMLSLLLSVLLGFVLVYVKRTKR